MYFDGAPSDRRFNLALSLALVVFFMNFRVRIQLKRDGHELCCMGRGQYAHRIQVHLEQLAQICGVSDCVREPDEAVGELGVVPVLCLGGRCWECLHDAKLHGQE